MAVAEAARLTEAHRLAQARLGAKTVSQMFAAWPLLDPTDLNGSFSRWLRVVVPLVQAQRSLSARLAANYLNAHRDLIVGSAFVPSLAGPAPLDVLTTSMLVTGPASIKNNTKRGMTLARAVDIGKANTSRAAMRHALNAGRETILDTVRADPQARGWARVTSGKACSFCSMLAGRGAVYGAETVDFHAHDGCSCGAAPVYEI